MKHLTIFISLFFIVSGVHSSDSNFNNVKVTLNEVTTTYKINKQTPIIINDQQPLKHLISVELNIDCLECEPNKKYKTVKYGKVIELKYVGKANNKLMLDYSIVARRLISVDKIEAGAGIILDAPKDKYMELGGRVSLGVSEPLTLTSENDLVRLKLELDR